MSTNVMKQALEALEDLTGWQTLAPIETQTNAHNAITALRAAIAQKQDLMVVSPDCVERGCMAHDDRVDGPGVVIGDRRCSTALPIPWLQVIDEAMVVHHCGVADVSDDYETAKRKMNDLLCVVQDIAGYFTCSTGLCHYKRPSE